MVALNSLLVLLALGAEVLATQTHVVCSTDLGTKSLKHVPTATATSRKKITVVKKVVKTVNLIVIPVAKTKILRTTTTKTATVTAGRNTKTATKTVTLPTTIVSTRTATSATTSLTTTIVDKSVTSVVNADPVLTIVDPVATTVDPVVVTIEPVATSVDPVVVTIDPATTVDPVVVTIDPVPTTVDPVVPTVNPVVPTVNSVVPIVIPVLPTAITVFPTGLKREEEELVEKRKAKASPKRYPQRVGCDKWITSYSTKTVSSTIQGPKITLKPITVTEMSTVRATATSTKYPADLKKTTTITIRPKVTSYTDSTTTTTVTQTVTIENQVTRETVY